MMLACAASPFNLPHPPPTITATRDEGEKDNEGQSSDLPPAGDLHAREPHNGCAAHVPIGPGAGKAEASLARKGKGWCRRGGRSRVCAGRVVVGDGDCLVGESGVL